jgi:eukaryotic-like serine/threonine-protein kinase
MSDVINKRFEVLTKIGEGGFGAVLLVRDHEIREICALKLIRPELAADSMVQAKFAKEAAIWMAMQKHPNVVSVRSLDYFNGKLFIALEFIPPDELGINSLDNYIFKRGIPQELLLRWAIQICQGMLHAASKGVIAHRDLKPSNLMIDPEGNVKITDFGLATFSVDRSSRFIDTSPSGTPVYMPPEQFISGATVDQRSDIYSLGLVLYQCATGGKLPFHVSCSDPRNYLAYFQELHRSYKLDRVDTPIYPIISRCLERHIENRYQTFEELEIDLQSLYKTVVGHTYQAPSEGEMTAAEHNNYALGYSMLSDPQSALRHINRALELAPFYTPAKSNKAAVLAQSGQIEQAAEIWKDLTYTNPELGRPFYNLGNLSMQQGDKRTAVALFKAAIELESGYVPAIVNMAICLQDLGRIPDAIALYDRALAVAPNDSQILYNKAVLMLDNRDPVGAGEIFRHVLLLNPNHVSAYNYLGVCHRTLGQIDDAIKCFDHALAIDPKYPYAIQNRKEAIDQKRKDKGFLGRMFGNK